MKCLPLSLALLVLAVWRVEAAIGDLKISQPISESGGHYEAAPQIHISFTLSAAQDVTVEIAAHLAVAERCSEYLAEPPVVRTLKLGRLEAGTQEAVWDGLAEGGKPVVQRYLKKRKTLLDTFGKPGSTPAPADLAGEAPVNLFEIRVRAGSEIVAGNFSRLAGRVEDSRPAPDPFDDACSDGEGGYGAISFRKWRGWRFNAQGNLLAQYPARPETWNGNVPVEAKQISVRDGKVYILSRGNGLLRYSMTGDESPWEAKADYIRGCRLGVTVSRPRPGQTNKISIGGKTIAYDASEADNLAEAPGFATDWGGADVDDQGVYLVQNSPRKELQIFDRQGNYQRTLELPRDAFSGLRCVGEGRVWLMTSHGPKLFDTKSGEVLQSLRSPKSGPFTGLAAGSDGTVYAWTAKTLLRYDATGQPKPFAASGLLEIHLPLEGALEVTAVAGDASGDFTVFVADDPKAGRGGARVLRYSAAGEYSPAALPQVNAGCERPGNVFVENEPARLALYFTSLEKERKPGRIEWTLTDDLGNRQLGTSAFPIEPMARQAASIPLPAGAFGVYHWEGKIFDGDQIAGTLSSSAARIRQHDLALSPDSPFGVVWGRDFYLMGLAGAKKERVGATSWSQVEPFDGVVAPEVDDITTGFLAMRRYANRWGVGLAEIFNYGEPWTSKGWLIQVHSFDRYFKHILALVDRVGGERVSHFQFWNEPNNFWKLPGPFSREHYAVVAENCWSIVKARAKETAFICDGDASTFGMMQELAKNGAAFYNDAVECHYLGSSAVSLTTMKSGGLPEGKAQSLEGLIKIRDQSYPGKPIYDTEEGVWGNRALSLTEGSQYVPRVYIPLLGGGLDALYWFRFACAPDDVHPSYMLDAESLPQPAYGSFATMTRILEGALPVGRVDLKDPDVYAYLFVRGGQAIVPIWTIGKPRNLALETGAASMAVSDMMDRGAQVRGDAPLSLSQSVQYVSFPRNDWAKSLVRAEFGRRLDALKVKDASVLRSELSAAIVRAPADPSQLSRGYELAKAGRLAALAGDAAMTPSAQAPNIALAWKAILGREGTDGFLENARLVLSWAERLERAAARQDADAAGRMRTLADWVAGDAANLAAKESPALPGVAVNAFIGDPGEIQRIRTTEVKGPDFPLVDAQFRYEIPKKAGESFSLELSIWNYYRHPISGKLRPHLPEGWAADGGEKAFSLQPGEFARCEFTVSISAGAAPGTYRVGGVAVCLGQEIGELHASRVRVER